MSYGKQFLEELEAEAPSARKCLERVPDNLFDWKPHEKSMTMGNVALIVADIPRWIKHTIKNDHIDFGAFQPVTVKTTADLVNHFDEQVNSVRKVLEHVSDEQLQEAFQLKNQGKVLFSTSKKDSIGSSVNHLVHHRGQLTVYLRLNNIAVPSIYGPSADDQIWSA